MSRGYGTTLGSGGPDTVTTTLISYSTLRSWSIWAYRRVDINAEYWNKDNGNEALSAALTGPLVRFKRVLTTEWSWAYTAPSSAVWTNILVTYDSGNPTTAPIVYYNGVVQTLASNVNGTGTVADVSDSNPIVIGNRAAADRNFDGMLAEFAVWDRILSASEAGVMAHYSPLFLPQSLVEYVPMIRDNTSLKNAAPTIGGTLVQPHPPIIYPTYAQVRKMSALVAAAVLVNRSLQCETGVYRSFG